jgi:hypothetical protein
MRRFEPTLRMAATLAARGEFSSLASRLRAHLWSDRRRVVLRRDLSKAIELPRSPLHFSLRRFEASDAHTLFDATSSLEQAERAKRERWIKAGMRNCYVAALRDRRATFMQWLCTPSDNRALRVAFPFEDLVVAPGTVLLEGAYTPPRFRHLPLMPAAMAQLAERGRGFGARWALVCVDASNESMLKAAQWAGFAPWRLKTIRRRCFVPSYHYAELRPSPGPDDRRGPGASPIARTGRDGEPASAPRSSLGQVAL